MTTEARRAQIIAATLQLVATTPVHRITTRRIAEVIGLTQPAIFRHFATRDSLLTAVVDDTRAVLEGVARQVVTSPGSVDAKVRLLVAGLFAHVRRYPGLPRLLFQDAGVDEPPPYRAALAHLVSMQRALVTELVRGGQAQGDVPPTVDALGAGRLLVALVQGTLLQTLAEEGRSAAVESADSLVDFWWTGLRHGAPAQVASPDQDDLSASPPVERVPLTVLDVRPILASGVDPLAHILDALSLVSDDGVLELTAPFQPTPLLALLGGRGLRVSAEELLPGTWVVCVLAAEAPDIADLRDLEAPEPLEQVLLATATLAPGAAYLARVPRFPQLLVPRLAERGLTWEAHEEPDGTALLFVRRPAPSAP